MVQVRANDDSTLRWATWKDGQRVYPCPKKYLTPFRSPTPVAFTGSFAIPHAFGPIAKLRLTLPPAPLGVER